MKCFVIMPFSKQFDSVKTAIKTAVTNVGLKYVRADEYYKAGKITDQLINSSTKFKMLKSVSVTSLVIIRT